MHVDVVLASKAVGWGVHMCGINCVREVRQCRRTILIGTILKAEVQKGHAYFMILGRALLLQQAPKHCMLGLQALACLIGGRCMFGQCFQVSPQSAFDG